MLSKDFVIQSNVRRILVRTNVDYAKMSFGTVRGIVYFRGLFQLTRVYVRGVDADDYDYKCRDFTIKTLTSLEKKIRNLPGVSDVIFQLSNLKKERGQWVPVKKEKRRAQPRDGQENEPSVQTVLDRD